jgi:transposase
MLFVGVDWGERHHDLCLLDQDGRVLAARRIADGLAGAGELHALVAAHAEQPAQVAVGIETDRGLLVRTLLAAGCQVYAVNPQVVGRYRGRHQVSRAKSDRGDAKVLADLVRTDRHNHRQVAGDSPLAEAVKVLARAHQSLIWARQRHVNGECVAERVAGVLPGGAGCAGRPARRARGPGGAGAGAHPGAGPPAHPGCGAARAGQRGPAP